MPNVCELFIKMVCSFDLGIKLSCSQLKLLRSLCGCVQKWQEGSFLWIWGSVLRRDISEGSSWGSWVLNRTFSLFLRRRLLWLGYTFNPFLSSLHRLPVGSKNGNGCSCLVVWGVAAFQCDPLKWALANVLQTWGLSVWLGTSPPPSP